MSLASRAFRVRCSQDAVLATLSAELDRREDWRATGSTSLASWMTQHLGVSDATARTYAQVAEHVTDLPHLAAGLAEGRLNLDKVRSLVGVATPENEARWAEVAEEVSFKDLGALVRSEAVPTRASDHADHERRSFRFNEAVGTMVAQLPPVSFAAVRSVLEARAKKMDSDGETPWDQRVADAFVSLVRSDRPSGPAGAPLLVAHTPLQVLTDPTSTLCGELESGDLLSADTVRSLACDATVVIAVDDDDGHTMYEGRQRRYATDAQRRELVRRDRHCRWVGCSNVLFLIAHHISEWQAGGPTDLPNLALLCEHHHHLIHSKAWSVSGDANGELRFSGPTGQVMASLPSKLWTRVADPGVRAGPRDDVVEGDDRGG